MFSEMALSIIKERYLRKDPVTRELLETPDDMLHRVTNALEDDRYYDLMASLDFLPNTPTLVNAGRSNGQLSACFVLPIEDSMDGIFTSLHDAAMIHKTGGGCLRKGALVATTRGIIPIEQVVVNDEVFALDSKTGLSVKAPVLDTHTYSVTEAYTIILDSGCQLTTSAWHPFMVFDGEKIIEKRADTLSLDDYIMVPSENTPKETSPHYNWLMGFFIGDGSYFITQGKEVVSFSVASEKEYKQVNYCCQQLFNKQYALDTSGSVNSIKIQGSKEISLFAELFTPGSKSTTVKLPTELQTPAAIAGLFDADATCIRNGKQKQIRIQFETSSERLAKDVCALLNLWGITTWYQKHESGKNSKFGSTKGNRVQINEAESLKRFMSIVGPYLCKLEVPEIESCWSNRPCPVKPTVDFCHDGTTRTYRWQKGKAQITYSTARRLIKDTNIINMCTFSRRVKSITKVLGGEDFYDLTVKGHKTYAGGEFGLMYVHNTGFSFSRLRHKGAPVYSTSGTSSGVLSFLHVYNEATNSVKQGGVRRGANMGILRIDHPDIEDFIMCKDDPSKLTNFNLSVGIIEGFMEAVRKDTDWPLINPAHKNLVKTVKARYLWNMIIHQAWKNGEPGIVFLDIINKTNPTPEFGEIEATNPCGEQPLLAYESCNLGSINLYNHVKDGRIDYAHLSTTVCLSVDFLNSVLDHNHFPLEKIKEQTLRTRKIGLGVMGWADALLALGMKYASSEATQLAEDVMEFINNTAWEYSRNRNYNNATCTTIAPTGTISMIANTSSGIEPNFSWVYRRKAMDKDFFVVHPLMEKELKKRNILNDATLQLLFRGVALNQIPGLQDLGDFWQLSHQISPEYHIRMQAAFQRYTDNAVSKTINLPSSATEDDVREAYDLAYQLGCKGVTVYRDNCRDDQVLNFAETKKPSVAAVRERPTETVGTTRKIEIGCGKLYVTVNADESGNPIEVFTNTGREGGCPAQSEGLARMISLCMRYNIPIEAIIKQLKGIRCMSTLRKKGCSVLSCPDAIGRTLTLNRKKEETGAATEEFLSVNLSTTGTLQCPECGQALEVAEGCVICHSCGYSKCG